MEDLLRMTNSFNCEGSVYPSIDESFRNRFYNFNRLLKTKYKFKRVDVFEDDTWNITDLMCGNLDVKNNENAILNFIYLENGIVSSKIKDFIEYVKIKNKIIRSCDFCYYRDFSLLFPIEFQCKRQGRFTNPIQEAQRCIMYSVQNVPNVKNEFSELTDYVYGFPRDIETFCGIKKSGNPAINIINKFKDGTVAREKQAEIVEIFKNMITEKQK
jgi:hypothetical protein